MKLDETGPATAFRRRALTLAVGSAILLAGSGRAAQKAQETPPAEYGVTEQDLQTLTDAMLAKKANLENNIKAIQKDADNGNPIAMTLTAIAYYSGWGVPVNATIGASYLKMAANAGSERSAGNLGSCYIIGCPGIEKDILQGQALLAKHESTYTESLLGVLKLRGIGIPKDTDSGLSLLTRSAGKGNFYAKDQLAGAYIDGTATSGNPALVFDIYTKNAANGDEFAAYTLGAMYYSGTGVGQDYGQARYLYNSCANLHYSLCKVTLGAMLLKGLGGPPDTGAALKLLQEVAADKTEGFAVAENLLGVAYGDGIGVPKRPEEAFRHYTIAANAGDAMSQANLGVAYRDGQGTKKDGKMAVYWLTKSADQGNAIAMNDLGVMYNNGGVVHKDNALAQLWLQKAIAAGSEIAKRNLMVTQRNADQSVDPAFAQNMMGLVGAIRGLKNPGAAITPPPMFQAAQPAVTGGTSNQRAPAGTAMSPPASNARPAQTPPPVQTASPSANFRTLTADENRTAQAATYDQYCAGRTVTGSYVSDCTRLLNTISSTMASQPKQQPRPAPVAVVHHPSYTHSATWVAGNNGAADYRVTVNNTGDVNLQCFIHLTAIQWNTGYAVASTSLQHNYNDVVTVTAFVGRSDSHSWAGIVPGSPGYTVECHTI